MPRFCLALDQGPGDGMRCAERKQEGVILRQVGIGEQDNILSIT
jgi:hypothetical protein